MPLNKAPQIDFPFHMKTVFDEIRVSQQRALFDHSNIYELDAEEYGSSVVNGGTVSFDSSSRSIVLSATSSSTSSAALRTHTQFRYQSGKGIYVRLSVYHSNAGVTNQTRRWGYFDDNDGIFFELVGTALRLVRRTSSGLEPSVETVSQSNWNVDKMDGSGPSQKILDITKINGYEISLGFAGAIVFVGNDPVHIFSNENRVAAPLLRISCLPLAMEIINSGSSTASTMTFWRASIVAPSGEADPHEMFSIANGSNKSVSTEAPLLSIRPKSTYAGLSNRSLLFPTSCQVANITGGPSIYRLRYNSILTNASWISVAANSVAEYDTSATASSNGQILYTGLLPNTTDFFTLDVSEMFSYLEHKLRVLAFTGTQETLTITGENISGGSATMRASVNWHEIR